MTLTLRPRTLTAALVLALAAGGGLCWGAQWLTRSCCAPPLPRVSEAVRQMRPAIVSLDLEDKAGAASFAAALVYRTDGHLVTAAHAAQPGVKIRVVLADGSRVAAEIVGRDEVSDVAVLKITSAHTLTPVRFAREPVQPGDAVTAIGDPLGYRATLTAGIVSSAARAYGPVNPYDHIQHDAALNPGSSGGALLNATGEVIGMNVAIADGSRRHVGIGLAVPAAVVQRIADRLIRDGRISRPELGLRLRDATGLSASGGGAPLIEDVEAGSAADRAGLKPGMSLLAANGQPLRAPRDLARVLEPLASGDGVSLDIRDRGEARRLALTLAAPAQSLARTRSLKPPTGAALPFEHGVVLESGGTRIEKVEDGSVAASAGLKTGDHLLAIGAHPVDGGSAGVELARAAGSRLALLVRRDGVSRYVVLGAQGRIDSSQPFGANAEAEGSSRL